MQALAGFVARCKEKSGGVIDASSLHSSSRNLRREVSRNAQNSYSRVVWLTEIPAFWLPRSSRKIYKFFATPTSHFPKEQAMNDPIQNKGEMKELKYGKSSVSTEGAETNERTGMSMKDGDTILSMIVLLLSCLALAVLAHVFV
jgi:hypothetical protein